MEIKFSFDFEKLGNKYTKENFLKFKIFVEQNISQEDILTVLDNKFLESNLVLKYTNKYVDLTVNNDKIKEYSKEIYLGGLKKFFWLIIENDKIKINKKFLKLCVKKIEKKNSVNDNKINNNYFEDDVSNKNSQNSATEFSYSSIGLSDSSEGKFEESEKKKKKNFTRKC